MKIMTKRLCLRPFKEDDARDWFYITQDKAAYRYLPYTCPITIHKAIADVKDRYCKCDFENNFYFIIDEVSLRKPIGALFIEKNPKSNAYEMLFIISKDFRRHGYMEEALKGFLKKWPQDKPLFCDIDSDNYATEKLMDKITSAKVVFLNINQIIYSLNK